MQLWIPIIGEVGITTCQRKDADCQPGSWVWVTRGTFDPILQGPGNTWVRQTQTEEDKVDSRKIGKRGLKSFIRDWNIPTLKSNLSALLLYLGLWYHQRFQRCPQRFILLPVISHSSRRKSFSRIVFNFFLSSLVPLFFNIHYQTTHKLEPLPISLDMRFFFLSLETRDSFSFCHWFLCFSWNKNPER